MNIDQEIIAAMAAHGGSFVKALAECARRADPNNLQRLKVAFPEYWVKYAELAGFLERDRELSPAEASQAVSDAFARLKVREGKY